MTKIYITRLFFDKSIKPLFNRDTYACYVISLIYPEANTSQLRTFLTVPRGWPPFRGFTVFFEYFGSNTLARTNVFGKLNKHWALEYVEHGNANLQYNSSNVYRARKNQGKYRVVVRIRTVSNLYQFPDTHGLIVKKIAFSVSRLTCADNSLKLRSFKIQRAIHF